MRHAWIAFASFVFFGCSSTDEVPPPDVALSVGQEEMAWTDEPPPTRIRVDLIQQADGSRAQLTEVDVPRLGKVDGTSPPTIIRIPERHFDRPAIARFEVTALGGDRSAVLRGSSMFFGMTSIYAVRIPIFMGRVQQWSRPLSQLGAPHHRPVVNTLYELLIVAGGDEIANQNRAIPEFFDAAVWQTVSTQPPLPRAPKSMASVGTKLLVLDDAGATWLDLATDKSDELDAISPPLDFSQVAGGETLEQPEGLRYIVGATRQDGAPTDKVLHIGKERKPSALTLSTPRAAAAAVFAGKSLVVAGGTPTGALAEVLAPGATTFMPLPYPPDATAGLGVTALDEKTVLVIGGKDPATGTPSPMRTIDLTCAATCAPTDVGALPVTLTRTKVFVLAPTQLLIVGETEETGVNRAFSIDPSQPPPFTPVEIVLKEPRAKATPAILPNGQVGLVGGHRLDADQSAAASIEIFIP